MGANVSFGFLFGCAVDAAMVDIAALGKGNAKDVVVGNGSGGPGGYWCCFP